MVGITILRHYFFSLQSCLNGWANPAKVAPTLVRRAGAAGGHLLCFRSSTMSPHRLHRAALHLPLRRLERGLLYFHQGLLSLLFGCFNTAESLKHDKDKRLVRFGDGCRAMWEALRQMDQRWSGDYVLLHFRAHAHDDLSWKFAQVVAVGAHADQRLVIGMRVRLVRVPEPVRRFVYALIHHVFSADCGASAILDSMDPAEIPAIPAALKATFLTNSRRVVLLPFM
jgi:hypothetical protein